VEEYTVTTNDNGLVSLAIGSGSDDSPTSVETLKSSEAVEVTFVSGGDFSSIDWSDGPYFIKVETDPTGGTNYTITGTSQLLSVPYAKYADKASNVKFTDGDNSDDAVYTKGDVGVGTTSPLGRLDVATSGWSNPFVVSNSTYGHTNIIQAGDGLLFRNIHATGDTVAYGFRNSSDIHIMDILSNGNVGIGTSKPQAPLHINTRSIPALIISSSITNDPARPGIQFTNNTSHFISGDDLSDELFGFYSIWANKRTYDAKLRVYGKTAGSWGTYIELTHDGTNGRISTDVGDINLMPQGDINANDNKITNLAAPVSAKDAATKEYVDEIKELIYEDLLNVGLNGIVEDIDGNKYPTIRIGNQIWMAKDLEVTHYPNGDPVPNVIYNDDWNSLGDNDYEDAYCFYNNYNNIDYGALYTYAAAIGDNWVRDNKDGQGICPDGWHLPTNDDWSSLVNYLGGSDGASGKMKEMGTIHWISPNEGADNSSGYTALPDGSRKYDGVFSLLGEFYFVWSATNYDSNNAYFCSLNYNNDNFFLKRNYKSYGHSVRCIKD